ncbi:MAG: flippase [Sphingobacteriaceae bacterium]
MKIPSIPGFDEQAFEKYFKNTGWLLFGKILSLVVGFLIARYLGPYAFGDLSFADAFAALFAAVGTLGLDSFIIREIIQQPHQRDEILGTSLGLRLGANIVLIPLTVLVYLLFHHFSGNQTSPSLAILVSLCASASLFKSFNIIDSYFQSQVASKFVVQVQNICLLLSAALKIALVYTHAPVINFAWALVFDSAILALGLLLIYKKQELHFRTWTFNWARAKSLLSQSWPLILTAVMISIYMKIDQVMLKSLGSRQVGIYSAAARISESWYFIPVAIVTSVFPAIIHARKTDIARYQKRLQNLYDLLVGISIPVAILISLSANTLISILYGDAYEGAGILLSIHIWSGIFVFLGSASSQYLLAEGFTMVSFSRTAFGALINVLLNLWLIPNYGAWGASVATLIAYAASTFFILFIPHTRKQGLLMLKSLFLISIIQKIFKIES